MDRFGQFFGVLLTAPSLGRNVRTCMISLIFSLTNDITLLARLTHNVLQ